MTGLVRSVRGEAQGLALHRARRRLTRMALLFCVTSAVGSMSGLVWFLWQDETLNLRYTQHFDLGTAAVWGLAAALGAVRGLSDRSFLRVGEGLLVLACFVNVLLGVLAYTQVGRALPVFAWNTVFITVYPLMVPAPPRRTALLTGIAVLSAPLAMLTLSTQHAFPGTDYLALTIAPCIGAVFAVVGSELIWRDAADQVALEQQDALLTAILNGVAEALLLKRDGEVLFANGPARMLLGADLASGPDALKTAMAAGASGLMVADYQGRRQSFLLARSPVEVDGSAAHLWVIRTVTAELESAEVESWKGLIRALSHELNNSLAPMSSLVHSSQLVLERPPGPERRAGLQRALQALEDRVQRLGAFLHQYAAFARLPRPRSMAVEWVPFLSGLSELVPFVLDPNTPASAGWFDPGQLEQVLLNLLKNAEEAGATPGRVQVSVHERDEGVEIQVTDDGRGLSDEAEERSFVPGWSTRPDGSGLGLAICRDIVGAHGGWLALGNRPEGGARATIWLPTRT